MPHGIRDRGREWGRILLGSQQGHGDGGVGHEWEPAGQALVGHHPERVHVGGRADRPAGHLLGGEVAGRTEDVADRGEPVGRDDAGDAEVGEHEPAVRAQQEVSGLDVTVHDPAAVGLVQGAGGLGDERHRLGRREWPGPAEHGVQWLPRYELHHDVRDAPGLPVVVHLHDVRVAEGRHGPGLGSETLGKTGVARQIGEQHFDRDRAAEHLVVSPPDLTHAAPGDRFAQGVPVPEPRSGLKQANLS